METPVESSALLELETEAASPTMASSFWDLVNGNPSASIEKTKNRSHSITKKSSKQSKNFNFHFQVALFVLLVAFLIGGSITVFNPVKLVH
ncbi:hypothetical protein KFK09_007860 [Dendrobium nobile]|uniref:Transmembrane protein n=1 Tax=Dendrobium nobile TaxID=94219 RepID=A0A8T3BT11_DENNO|nr:hypothetical protein KFK09_007860 [Dendrobium nobile]